MGEFNVNKTTGGLDPTAGMPDTYPATQVMMSDGVTSVEDAIGEVKSGLTNVESALAHDYAGSVDISSYNTIDNPYTLQWNGYVRINGTGSVMLLAQDNASISILEVANNNDLISVYVKKGSRIYVTASVALYIIMT